MMQGPDLELTAVVACRDDEERVGHTVRRLATHLRGLRLPFEIIAVDEFSGDNTLTLLALLRREIPELKVVPGAAPGRGYVRGAGLARGRAVLLVDARCEAPFAALGFALGRLAEGFDAAAVHGRYLVLRRARAMAAFDALAHRRDPVDLEQRFARRAASLGLKVHRAGRPATPATTWHRFRDAVLVPLASRAWW
jgi:hypothetical protein